LTSLSEFCSVLPLSAAPPPSYFMDCHSFILHRSVFIPIRE
jgi:hypothetical protein